MIMFSRIQATLICALVLLTALASACSKQETARTLARRLGEADRVIIASQYAGSHPPVQLTTEETKRLVQAVAGAKKESRPLTATPELLFRFFKDTNVVAEFDAGVTVFWIDHGPDPKQPGLRRATTYWDRSGTLKMISEKFLDPEKRSVNGAAVE
jgi:L-rhamnose isomerase